MSELKAIVWPFVDEGARYDSRGRASLGYRESFANSEAVIDVEWSSPEEYIASRSKNVRRTLRNELAWVHDQGIRVSWETDLAPAREQPRRLLSCIVRRAQRPRATLSPRFFARARGAAVARRTRAVRVARARRCSRWPSRSTPETRSICA